jgi:alanyl-tRNA synthetase
MERARQVSRSRKAPATATAGNEVHVEHDDVMRFARQAGFRTRFVGYETTEAETVLRVAERADGWLLAKLEESPFYPEGGGQVSDTGTVETPSGRARVVDVYRLGDDQALALEPVEGAIGPGEPVRASVERAARLATMRNHTATHLLHAALRERLGTHVRQAGSYVGPDKLRFDFTHRGRVPAETLERIEAMVNERVAEDQPVQWEIVGRDEAADQGAIGLFEEKYGERVRVLSTGDFSKELCGGTHVSRTGEIGPFTITSEGSTGAGARRIEALTGPAAVEWLRERERRLQAELAARDERIRALEAELRRAKSGRVDVGAVVGQAVDAGPVRAVAAQVEAIDMDELLAISDRVKQALGDGAAVVLGATDDGKAMLVANLAPGAVAAGLSAGALIREVAPIVGGGGGGRDAMARAGGKDAARLPEALEAARAIMLSAREA